jgi:hypothetical protein
VLTLCKARAIRRERGVLTSDLPRVRGAFVQGGAKIIVDEGTRLQQDIEALAVPTGHLQNIYVIHHAHEGLPGRIPFACESNSNARFPGSAERAARPPPSEFRSQYLAQ